MHLAAKRAEAATSTLSHAARQGGRINPHSMEVTMVTNITSGTAPAIALGSVVSRADIAPSAIPIADTPANFAALVKARDTRALTEGEAR